MDTPHTFDVTRANRFFRVEAASPEEAAQKVDAFLAKTARGGAAPASQWGGAGKSTIPEQAVPKEDREDILDAHDFFAPDPSVLNLLKQIGCSNWDYESVTYGEARNVYRALLGRVVQLLGIGLAITLTVTFTVYGVIRAIGWVIGGFTAS